MSESVPGSFREFDLFASRFFGGRAQPGPGRPSILRVDVSSLLSTPAREMFDTAVEHAAARGATDLGSVDLLAATAASDRGRSLLVAAGASPDLLCLRIGELTAAASAGPPGPPPSTLSPAVKRALLDAQRIGRALGASYIGPEHLLRALAANRECTASRLLGEQGVTVSEIPQAPARRVVAGRAAEAGAGTPMLTSWGRDLTERAREGQLDPVVGRDDVIEQAIEILSRRTNNNPCLIGEPGVGKTVIVEGIAQRIVNGDVPDPLMSKRVVALDLAVMAGRPAGGASTQPLSQIIDEIKAHADELVVFIDGLHLAAREGAAGEGAAGDGAANPMAAALARGELHVIGATTIDGYRTISEVNAALERHLQPLVVPEPSIAETIAILGGLRDRYEAYHQVRITDDAIGAAARMSEKYIAGRFEPDKAIDLMDQAAARVGLRARTPAPDVRVRRQRLAELRRDCDQAAATHDFARAAECAREISLINAALAGRAPYGGDEAPDVTGTDVAEVVCLRSGIPMSRLTATEPDVLLNLEEQLHHRVIGQDEAVSVIAEAARRDSAGLAGPGRPAGSFLFAGPAGVGKSELARALAEVLFGGEDQAIRIDMGDYSEPDSGVLLTGTPHGRDGHAEPGRLTEAVRLHPHSVVVLDEIGTAAPEVRNIVLQILQDGRLSDGSGRTVDFSAAIIIMTTTVEAGQMPQPPDPATGAREVVTDLLRRRLGAQLINTIDEVVIFSPLDKVQLCEVAGLMLAGTGRLMLVRGVRLRVTDSAKGVLAEMGYQPGAGAHQLLRTVRREVTGRLSRMLLSGEIGEGDTATVGADGTKIVIGVGHGPVRVGGQATAPRPRRPAASENMPAGSENMPAGSENPRTA